MAGIRSFCQETLETIAAARTSVLSTCVPRRQAMIAERYMTGSAGAGRRSGAGPTRSQATRALDPRTARPTCRRAPKCPRGRRRRSGRRGPPGCQGLDALEPRPRAPPGRGRVPELFGGHREHAASPAPTSGSDSHPRGKRAGVQLLESPDSRDHGPGITDGRPRDGKSNASRPRNSAGGRLSQTRQRRCRPRACGRHGREGR
jgi:hypothetical protein